MTSRRSQMRLRPHMLVWARERSGLGVDELARKVSVKPERVHDWERSGGITMPQAERLAKATRAPFGYLFMSDPPDERLPIPDFRARGDDARTRPSPDLLETVYAMQRRQAWMREELIDDGAAPLDSVGAYHTNSDVARVAEAMRASLSLCGRDWAATEPNWSLALRRLRDAAEDSGNSRLLQRRRWQQHPPQARSGRVSGIRIGRRVCPLDIREQRRLQGGADVHACSRIGASAHWRKLACPPSGTWNPRPTPPNDFGDQAAAEFLVPEDEILAVWSDAKQGDAPCQVIARRFKVSSIVAARRALDLELIDRESFFAFYNDNRARASSGPQTSDGGNFWNTQRWRIDNRFPSAVVRAVKEGRLSYTEGYSLTGLRGETFESLSHNMGFQS